MSISKDVLAALTTLVRPLRKIFPFERRSTFGDRRNEPFVTVEVTYRNRPFIRMGYGTNQGITASQAPLLLEPLPVEEPLPETESKCIQAYFHLVTMLSQWSVDIRNGKQPHPLLFNMLSQFVVIEGLFAGYGYRTLLPTKGIVVDAFDLNDVRRSGLLTKRLEREILVYYAPRFRRHFERCIDTKFSAENRHLTNSPTN
jgi:hypothetical protein